MTTKFTWIPIYQELAKALSGWQNRQGELISFLNNLREQKYVITSLQDKDSDGANFLLKEIDPFTFFGVFNRGIKKDQRIAILMEMKKYFSLQSSVPDDFDGVPVLVNMKSWFFPYQYGRDANDISKLWHVFLLALENDPLDNAMFMQAFDDALSVNQTNINLTMGLFWIRPDTFLSLDGTNRSYLQIKLPAKGLSSKYYAELVDKIRLQGKPFTEISYAAWQAMENLPSSSFPGKVADNDNEKNKVNYWLVGAYWHDKDPNDQTKRFLVEGIWENGYRDRLLDDVKSMRVNDKIAIKAAFTQRKDLPFDNQNKTVSRMAIKAIGTIVANRDNGRTVEVEWDQNFKEKNWYFYTHRGTLWRLKCDNDYKFKDYVLSAKTSWTVFVPGHRGHSRLINAVCNEIPRPGFYPGRALIFVLSHLR